MFPHFNINKHSYSLNPVGNFIFIFISLFILLIDILLFKYASSINSIIFDKLSNKSEFNFNILII